jgi:hypothetical protein
VKREVVVHNAENSIEVVPEGANSTFSRITTVATRRDYWVVKSFTGHVLLEDNRCLVFHLFQCRL